MLKTQQALGLPSAAFCLMADYHPSLSCLKGYGHIFSYGNILDHATKTFAVTAISVVKFFITCLVSKILKGKKRRRRK